ncbi:embryo-specific protein ATS3A-like isoform X1 [Prosopis cineraria]|uniref:embryo-specific protein ATS3A-like isoform X1 n=2 Tax=Prosopis cineraria TaxID=364024 RepID=UPI00240EF101|nr:embryo-specific protein ATS3A-like isoform X1 [Prosopis cineraria]
MKEPSEFVSINFLTKSIYHQRDLFCKWFHQKTEKMGKSCGGPCFLCFTLLLVPLLQAEQTFPSENKKNCTYVITIETTCTVGAETSNHVSLRFGDTNSNDIVVRHLNSKHIKKVDPLEPEVLDDVPRRPFQACMVDQFLVTAPCVDSPICYLYLKMIGSDDWRPGFAQVRVLGRSHLSSNLFHLRRFMPRHVWHGADACDREVTPFGLRKRKAYVKTP